MWYIQTGGSLPEREAVVGGGVGDEVAEGGGRI
jgi:hypothetical protein